LIVDSGRGFTPQKKGTPMFENLKQTFIIAEMGANHLQNLDKAKSIVDAAKSAGADAVKVQLFQADKITLNSDKKHFRVKWKNEATTLYELYSKCAMPFDFYPELIKHAKQKKIVLFPSVMHIEAVDFAEEHNTPFYKIASFEVNDVPLLNRIAKTKKPVLISTGCADDTDIETALKILKKNEVVLLHCVSNYPVFYDKCNMQNIHKLKELVKTVGYSDHTLGLLSAIMAVVMGATIIEKHFTDCRDKNSPDSDFSFEPDELKNLIFEIRLTEKALLPADKTGYTKLKKSIFIKESMKKGERFSADNICVVRPGAGVSPALYADLIDSGSATKALKENEPLKEGDYETDG
jgi:pseudaminic acid synthase